MTFEELKNASPEQLIHMTFEDAQDIVKQSKSYTAEKLSVIIDKLGLLAAWRDPKALFIIESLATNRALSHGDASKMIGILKPSVAFEDIEAMKAMGSIVGMVSEEEDLSLILDIMKPVALNYGSALVTLGNVVANRRCSDHLKRRVINTLEGLFVGNPSCNPQFLIGLVDHFAPFAVMDAKNIIKSMGNEQMLGSLEQSLRDEFPFVSLLCNIENHINCPKEARNKIQGALIQLNKEYITAASGRLKRALRIPEQERIFTY